MPAAADASPTPDGVREEMRHTIRALAGLWSGHGFKGALSWAARKAGITTSEAKRLAYAEMNIVPAHIADRVRAAAEAALIERELAAVDELLARIERDDRNAALVRALASRLADPPPSARAAGSGEGARPG